MRATRIECKGEPLQIAFDGRGRWVVLALRDGVDVRVLATGERLWRASIGPGVSGAAFAENGRSVVAATPSGLLRVAEDEAPRAVEGADAGAILASSHHARVALLFDRAGHLQVLDLETLRPGPPSLTAVPDGASGLVGGAVNDAGTRVVTWLRWVTAGAQATTRIDAWKCQAPDGESALEEIPSRKTAAAGITEVALSPNGARLAFVAGGALLSWQLERGTMKALLAPTVSGRGAARVAFSADGRFLLCGPSAGTFRVLDRLGERAERTFEVEDPCRAAMFSPDGRSIVTLHERAFEVRTLG